MSYSFLNTTHNYPTIPLSLLHKLVICSCAKLSTADLTVAGKHAVFRRGHIYNLSIIPNPRQPIAHFLRWTVRHVNPLIASFINADWHMATENSMLALVTSLGDQLGTCLTSYSHCVWDSATNNIHVERLPGVYSADRIATCNSCDPSEVIQRLCNCLSVYTVRGQLTVTIYAFQNVAVT
jgi:hypothetical protein